MAFGLASSSSKAFADAATSLDWQAPPECARMSEVAAAVSQQLGRPAFGARSDDVELVVRVSIAVQPSGRYLARITLATPEHELLGERDIESDNRQCRSLDEALAVTLAIMLSATQEELRSREPPPWAGRTSVVGGLGFGWFPRPGLAFAAGGALTYRRRWALELALGYGWSPRAEVAEGGLRVQAASASLGGSVALLTGQQELRLRLMAGAGPIWAKAYDFSHVSTQARAFVVLGAGLDWAVRLGGPLWAEFQLNGGWLPVRPTFAVQNLDGTLEPLFEPGPLIGSFVGGPALHFD
ncbi:MAG TPA: hypothetical protein VM686_04875 [Polyangiaceae bacterium]|nr:hypothetical protein [Polyangiaceae bacterium]